MIRSFEGSIIERVDKGGNSIAAAEELCLVPGQYNLIRTSTASSGQFFLLLLCCDGAGRFLRSVEGKYSITHFLLHS